MSWQFVLRPNIDAGDNIEKAIEQVSKSAYRFFLFNGVVYFWVERYVTIPVGIYVEDLY